MLRHHAHNQPYRSSYAVVSASFHEEIKTEEQSTSHCCSRFTSTTFSLVLTTLNAVIQTLQFKTGLQDLASENLLAFIPITPEVRLLLTLLFLVQSGCFSYKSTRDGIEKIWNSHFEKLPRYEAIKANISSFFINFYAVFSDAIATTYYLEQQGYGLNKIMQFVIGIITAFSSLPTENFETNEAIRLLFSKTDKLLSSEFKKIQQTDFYAKASSPFKKNLDAFWEMLSVHIKISFLTHKDELENKGDFISLMFNVLWAESASASDMKNALLGLKIDESTADQYANELFALKELRNNDSYSEEKEDTYGVGSVLGRTAYAFVKNLLKLCGGLEDTVESYASMAIWTQISNAWFRRLTLLLGFTNGINDIIFYGGNSSRVIDTVKEHLMNGDYHIKEVVLFLFSIFTASMVGHAQFKLILGMLHDRNTTLPDPLPARLPETISIALALGAALRELVYYSDNFYSLFDGIIQNAEHILAMTSRWIKGIDYQKNVAFSFCEEEIQDWVQISTCDEDHKPEAKDDETEIIFDEGFEVIPTHRKYSINPNECLDTPLFSQNITHKSTEGECWPRFFYSSQNNETPVTKKHGTTHYRTHGV